MASTLYVYCAPKSTIAFTIFSYAIRRARALREQVSARPFPFHYSHLRISSVWRSFIFGFACSRLLCMCVCVCGFGPPDMSHIRISNVMELQSAHSSNWLNDWKALCFHCASVWVELRWKAWKTTVLRLVGFGLRWVFFIWFYSICWCTVAVAAHFLHIVCPCVCVFIWICMCIYKLYSRESQ